MSKIVTQADWRAFWRSPGEERFLPVYEGTKRLVHTVCLRLLQDSEDARDAFQSTYARLLAATGSPRERRRMQGVSDPGELLFRLAVREADSLRKRRGRRLRRETTTGREVGVQADASQPDARAMAADVRATLERLVNDLPDRFRVPLLLHFFHGFSQREIARGTRQPVSTVSDRIREGVARLEPIARRAGLEDAGALLAGIATAAHLLTPTASAAAVYGQAIGSVASAGGGAGIAAESAGLFQTTVVGAIGMKTKVAACLALVAILGLGFAVRELLLSVEPTSPGGDVEVVSTERASALSAAPDEVVPERAPSDAPRSEAGGPRQLRVGVRWKPGGDLVPDATVHLEATDSTDDGVAAVTGKLGVVELEVPADRERLVLVVRHPLAIDLQREVHLEPSTGLTTHVAVELARLGLSGFVVDQQTQEPVAGAVVRSERETALRAVTDEEGYYALEETFSREVELEVTASGYATTRARIAFSNPGEPSERTFQLEAGFTLELHVVNEDGEPIEGAQVLPERLPGYYNGRDMAHTDASGWATLHGLRQRGRPQRVRVRAEGYAKVDLDDARPAADTDAIERELVLPREAKLERTIAGRVTAPQGRPVAGVAVQWTDVRTVSHGGKQGKDLVTTDADGHYRLDFEHDDDTCFLGASRSGWAPFVQKAVPLGTPDAPAVLDIVLEPGAILEGRVVNEEGAALVGVRVIAALSESFLHLAHVIPGTERKTTTDPDGAFVLRDLPASTVALEVWLSGYTERQLADVAVGEPTEIVLKKRGMLRGQIVDAETGHPVPAFTVRLTRGSYGMSRGSPGESFTTEDGRFVLDRLDRDMLFSFAVDAEGYASGAVEEVEALPQDQAPETIVRLSPARYVEGEVVDATSGQPLSGVAIAFVREPSLEREPVWMPKLWSTLPGYDEQQTGDAGRFRFTDSAPAGRLQLLRPGYCPLVIEPTARSTYAAANGGLRVPLLRAARLLVKYSEHPALAAKDRLSLYRVAADGTKASSEPLAIARPDGTSTVVWDLLAPGTYFVDAGAHRGKGSELGRPRFRTMVVEVVNQEETVHAEIGADLGELTWSGTLTFENAQTAPASATLRLLPRFPAGFGEIGVLVRPESGWRFELPGLSPGAYEAVVTVRPHDRPARTVRLPLHLDASPAPTLSVPAP